MFAFKRLIVVPALFFRLHQLVLGDKWPSKPLECQKFIEVSISGVSKQTPPKFPKMLSALEGGITILSFFCLTHVPLGLDSIFFSVDSNKLIQGRL